MRIAMITYRGIPRGGIVHSAYLAEALAAQGHEVVLYYLWHKARDPKMGPHFFRPLSVQSTCVIYNGKETTVNISAVRGMVKALAEDLPNDFDIYHVHDAIGAAAVYKLKGRKGKMVWTIHHLDTYNDKELDNYFEKQLPKPDGYATVSEFWQKELKIEGTAYYGVERWRGSQRRTFAATLELMAATRAPLASLVTHKFGLEEYAKAIEVNVDRSRHRSVKALFVV